MKEQNSYFSHDGNARNDAKLLKVRMKHGAAGYGVYFMILERLREEDGYMSAKDYNMIAFDLRVDAGLIKSVVEDFGLFAFTEDGECFYSESFNRRMIVKDEIKKKRSEAGKKGGAPRGNDNASKNKNNQKQANGCFETSKESKGNKNIKKKESKENVSPRNVFHAPTISEVQDYITEKQLTHVSAERFMAYYESNGWIVGRNKMKSWKAALSMWEARDKDKPVATARSGSTQPTVIVPSAEDVAREREQKEAAERKRVIGIYESAKRGDKRMREIVGAWAQNGTLAKYGLMGL